MSTWRDLAACRGTSTEPFYADDRHRPDQLAAIAICAGCTVRQACLEDAPSVTSTPPLALQSRYRQGGVDSC